MTGALNWTRGLVWCCCPSAIVAILSAFVDASSTFYSGYGRHWSEALNAFVLDGLWTDSLSNFAAFHAFFFSASEIIRKLVEAKNENGASIYCLLFQEALAVSVFLELVDPRVYDP